MTQEQLTSWVQDQLFNGGGDYAEPLHIAGEASSFEFTAPDGTRGTITVAAR